MTTKKRIDHKELMAEARKFFKYKKDKKNKIAYLTLDRPENHNAVGAGMRFVFADYIAKINIDDDVKVLVIRGAGPDLGTGADVVEMANLFGFEDIDLSYEHQVDDPDVKYPPNTSNRYLSQMADGLSRAKAGARPLAEFKKISILQVQGYCYGWHFYQAADVDLIISSDDALYGHAGFRYAGWGPRLWTWIEMMGIRKFQEMLYTGRPFTAQEMYKTGFINSIVPRDKLEAEVEKYALACSRTRPTDTVVVQKTFMELYKQYRGEYFGSILSGMLEGATRYMAPDSEADSYVTQESYKTQGLVNLNRDIDMRYPPDFRLARGNRKKP